MLRLFVTTLQQQKEALFFLYCSLSNNSKAKVVDKYFKSFAFQASTVKMDSFKITRNCLCQEVDIIVNLTFYLLISCVGKLTLQDITSHNSWTHIMLPSTLIGSLGICMAEKIISSDKELMGRTNDKRNSCQT